MREGAREAHPAAALFPLIDGPEFDELVADIAEHGMDQPIILLDGLILDGRNRYRACQAAGIEPDFIEADAGIDPVAFVISANLRRRHLTESQRAMIAAKLANMRHGGDRRSDQAANLPLDVATNRASQLLNVSERSVRDARVVRAHGTPALASAVERGELPVSRAADIAREPATVQDAALGAAVTAARDYGAKARQDGEPVTVAGLKAAMRAAMREVLPPRPPRPAAPTPSPEQRAERDRATDLIDLFGYCRELAAMANRAPPLDLDALAAATFRFELEPARDAVRFLNAWVKALEARHDDKAA